MESWATELIQTETNCVLSTQAHFPQLFTNQTHRIVNSQNILSWKVHIRIIKSNLWICRGPLKNQMRCLKMLFLNSGRVSTMTTSPTVPVQGLQVLILVLTSYRLTSYPFSFWPLLILHLKASYQLLKIVSVNLEVRYFCLKYKRY